MEDPMSTYDFNIYETRFRMLTGEGHDEEIASLHRVHRSTIMLTGITSSSPAARVRYCACITVIYDRRHRGGEVVVLSLHGYCIRQRNPGVRLSDCPYFRASMCLRPLERFGPPCRPRRMQSMIEKLGAKGKELSARSAICGL
jgi:hypothetical protein